jgi:hypothetical protein
VLLLVTFSALTTTMFWGRLAAFIPLPPPLSSGHCASGNSLDPSALTAGELSTAMAAAATLSTAPEVPVPVVRQSPPGDGGSVHEVSVPQGTCCQHSPALLEVERLPRLFVVYTVCITILCRCCCCRLVYTALSVGVPYPFLCPHPTPVVHCAVDTPLLASRPSHGHGAGSSAGPASGPTPRHLSVQVDGVGVGDGGVLDFQRVGCLCSLGSPYCTPKLQRHRVRYQGVPWSFSTASPVLYRILRSSNIFAEVVASGMNIWRCACVVAPCVCSRGQPCPHQRPAGACSSPLAPPCPLLSTTVALLRDCPPRVQQV